MSLGQQIKKYRQALGLTLDQLSELSSVPPGTISALTVRNSVKSTYAPTLAKNGFGLSLEQLLDTETDWLAQCFDHVNANRPSGWTPTQDLLHQVTAARKAQSVVIPKHENTLAERLKAALSSTPQTTQRELAAACGVKPPSVSDWLSGKTKNIEGSHLLAASKVLKVNPVWLADGIGPMRVNSSDWPFPDIPRQRFDALTNNQKIEIQGAVRKMIYDFEDNSQSRKTA